ncbi:hypothetical protein [Burkholderia ubonensis]|uniref:Uncharacterized protein n=1 Tax=Burkholderia ubonensis TaxID=101571 RepID=A0A1B4LK59_9BURK|nr:hypothetical protein [Burkholderia ubonensis]AOJ77528.1 hypothetical protein WJ35_20740 [Burkholderia ubonensis]
MTFSQSQTGNVAGRHAFDAPPQYDADASQEVRATSYHAVLQEPTASLVGGTTDRPDVATAAILGYN